jgi:hypothetical protein
MNLGFSHTPLVTVGWKADEAYIQHNLDHVRAQNTLPTNGVDRLSIINRTWYPEPPATAQEKHRRVAATYNTDQNGCFFEVERSGSPSIDDLFHWMQTRYGLQLLGRYARHNANWVGLESQIDQALGHFQQPRAENLLYKFFDEFLSVWVRLCFSARRVVYLRHGAPVPPDLIPLTVRDEHIPWSYDGSARDDLLAVIPLVIRIWTNIQAGTNLKWDFGEFPGAIWIGDEGHLVVPLPAWDDLESPIELAGLKPLADSRGWPHRGKIQRLSILPLGRSPAGQPFEDPKLTMRNSLALLMKLAKFADSRNIEVVKLADI